MTKLDISSAIETAKAIAGDRIRRVYEARVGRTEDEAVATGLPSEIFVRINGETESTTALFPIGFDVSTLEYDAPIKVRKESGRWVVVTTDAVAGVDFWEGNAPGTSLNNAPVIVKTSFANLPNAQVLADLATGYVKVTTSTGVLSSQAVPIPVSDGGTGASTLTANNLLIGNGTSAVTFIAPSTSGNILRSNGTVWQSVAPSFDASVISSGTLDNARVNWASPGTIGSTTPNTGAFSLLTVERDWGSPATTNIIATFDNYADAGRFTIRRANGTKASPTQTLSGDGIGAIGFRGMDNVGAFSTASRANIVAEATQNYTATAQGAKLYFVSTPNGSTVGAIRLTVQNSGEITLASDSGAGTNEGSIGYHSTKKHMETYTAGAVGVLCRRLFALTSTSTIANTVTETAFTLTGDGITTLPANFFTTGKRIRIQASGYISSTGTPTMRLQVYVEGVSFFNAGLVTVNGLTNGGWLLDTTIDCYTTGVSGTAWTQGRSMIGANESVTANSATNTINTTATRLIQLTATWSAASPSNTITVTNFRIFEE